MMNMLYKRTCPRFQFGGQASVVARTRTTGLPQAPASPTCKVARIEHPLPLDFVSECPNSLNNVLFPRDASGQKNVLSMMGAQ